MIARASIAPAMTALRYTRRFCHGASGKNTSSMPLPAPPGMDRARRGKAAMVKSPGVLNATQVLPARGGADRGPNRSAQS